MADISENTPLLRDPSGPETTDEHESGNTSAQDAPDNSLRFVTGLTWLSLVLSVFIIVFDVTVNILDETHYSGGYYMPWDMRQAIIAMCIVVCAQVALALQDIRSVLMETGADHRLDLIPEPGSSVSEPSRPVALVESNLGLLDCHVFNSVLWSGYRSQLE